MKDKRSRRLKTRWTLVAVVAVAAVSVVLAGCGGGGSSDASTLLKQTFSGAHKVNSGQLTFSVAIQPSPSAPLKGPLALSFGGPFQSLGTGKLPQSNFALSLTALGRSISFGILSTGTAGYVSFQGSNYPLPQSEYQKLESSFASVASSPGGGHGAGILGRLGIQPLTWLRNPHVVGDETVGGTPTTHIHAGINVSVLLRDFNTFLQRASSLGVSGAASFPHGLSQTSIASVAGEIQNPSFDVWTGTSDKTVRKLLIHLSGPVPGQASSFLGSRAGLTISMQYANLNQPQTISPPTSTAPFSQFSSKVRTFLRALLGGALTGAGASSSSGSSSSGGGSGGAGSSSALNSYSQCIQAAGSDVSKMQQCASLLTK